MRKIVLSIAIVMTLTMLSSPVLGDMMQGYSYGSSGDNVSDSGMMNPGNNESSPPYENAQDMYRNATMMRESEGMMGMGFLQNANDNFGNFVTFSVDNATGNIINFAVQGNAIFDSINVSGFNFGATTTQETETKIVNKDGTIVIQVHDNPSAVIEMNVNKATNIVLNLASGATATKQNNIVTITAGNVTAFIVSGAASISISGSQISININHGIIVFRASPVNLPHDDMEEQFMGQVMVNKTGAEVSVGESDKSSIVNFSSNVSVTVDSVEANRMTMTVESSDHAGKLILMNIDNSSLMLTEGQNVTLYLDGKPMKEVMTEQELYSASESSFWINRAGPNKMEALVYISTFSTHTIDIVVGAAATPAPTTVIQATVTEQPTPTPTPRAPGFELAVGVLGTVAAAFILRRRL